MARAALLLLAFVSPAVSDSLSDARKLLRSDDFSKNEHGTSVLVAGNNAACVDALLAELQRLYKREPGLKKKHDKKFAKWRLEMGTLLKMYDIRIKALRADREKELKNSAKFEQRSNKQKAKVEKAQAEWEVEDRRWSPVRRRLDHYADALGKFESAEAAGRLAHAAGSIKPVALRCRVVGAVGVIGHESGKEGVLAAIADRDPRLRSAAARAAAKYIGDAAVQTAVRSCLEDDAWPVRRGAIDALGRLDREVALPILVEALSGMKGALAWRIEQILNRMTGQSFLADAAAWKKWWTENRASLPELEEAPPRLYGKPVFFDLPLNSRNLIIALGCARNYEGLWPRTVEQVKAAVEALPDGVQFNLVNNAPILEWFSKKPAVADDRSRRAALRWLDELPARGNLGDFLDEFQVDLEGKNGHKLVGTMADTLYLVGIGDNTERAAEKAGRFAAWNHDVGVIVHTAVIKTRAGKGELEDLLSTVSGGKHVVQER